MPAPSLSRTNCPACSGRLMVLTKAKRPDSGTPVVYFRCEKCAHVVIREE